MENPRDLEKFVHRQFCRAALCWDVDPNNAFHNPVFIRNGRMNYCHNCSPHEQAIRTLREEGVLEAGFNGASQLTVDFDELDVAADLAFERGCNMAEVIELMEEFLTFWRHSKINWNKYCPSENELTNIRTALDKLERLREK